LYNFFFLFFFILSGNYNKEGRPRNLGRGVSKPKKNTVASLLAQSRAVGIKPQQLMGPGADIVSVPGFGKAAIFLASSNSQEKIRQAINEASQAMETASNTDTESLAAESGLSESEGEEQINLGDLRIPLTKGWKRETIIRGLTKNGQIKGEVFYYAPGGQTNKLKHMSQIQTVRVPQKHWKK
jgi:hypothetical protein